MGWSTGKRIGVATLVAGTLDILAAAGLTLYYGKRSVEQMLAGVGSGPYPPAANMGSTGAAIGLVTHYVLMAIMAAVFVFAADRIPALKRQPLLWGLLYGLATYVVMNLIVLHLRFDTPLPPSTAAIVSQLFCHIVLVGVPVALVARKG